MKSISHLWKYILFATLINFGFSQTVVWQNQYIGSNQLTTTIKAVNKDVVWLCGTSGAFYTTNGGNTWTNCLTGIIQMIETINDSTALAAMEVPSGTSLYLTNDFGKNWNLVHTNSSYINGIKMFDQTQGIAIGDPKDSVWRILRTTDGGKTWNQENNSPRITSCEAGNRNSVSIADKNYVWFGVSGCGGHKIYKSNDRGISWEYITTPFDDTYALWFSDSLHSVAAFGSGFFYTKDGGISWKWNSQIIPHTYNVSGTKNGILWGTGNSSVYTSSDTGVTWNEKYRYSQSSLGHLSVVVDNGITFGWVATENGNIIKFFESPTAITKIAPINDKTFSMSLNYPNPFNPLTHIVYTISKKSNVTLKIFDCLGNEVEMLVNSIHEPGKYNVDFRAEKLSSGVYFYTIVTEYNSESKKIVFIK